MKLTDENMGQQTERFRQSTPYKLELDKGGGLLGCFGLPFFGAGVFMLMIVGRIVPISNAADIPWWSWIVLLMMGLIFTTVGATLVFGRKWITLDTLEGRIWIAWGLLYPMRGTTYDLKDYTRIVLKFIPGDSDSADSYEIVLKTNLEGELSLLSSLDYGQIFIQATKLSEFLKLPLEDRSTEHVAIVKPGESKSDLTDPNPITLFDPITAPSNLTSDIQIDESSISIRVPNTKYSLYRLAELIIPGGFVLFLTMKLLPFFRMTNTPPPFQMMFAGFIGVFFVLLPVISLIKRYLASRGYSTEVHVNDQGITIKQNKRSKHITANKIIAIDYGTRDTALNGIATDSFARASDKNTVPYIPAWLSRLQRLVRSKGVIIKSIDGIFYIGSGLPDAEVIYLYRLIAQYFPPK